MPQVKVKVVPCATCGGTGYDAFTNAPCEACIGSGFTSYVPEVAICDVCDLKLTVECRQDIESGGYIKLRGKRGAKHNVKA